MTGLYFESLGLLALGVCVYRLTSWVQPRIERRFGATEFQRIHHRIVERGPFSASLSPLAVSQLICRTIVWGGRRRIYGGISEAPQGVRPLAWLSVFSELVALALIVLSGLSAIDATDRSVHSPVVLLTQDRIQQIFQQLCGEGCPRSTYERFLLVSFLTVVAIYMLVPNPRYKWLPSEGRYVRRW